MKEDLVKEANQEIKEEKEQVNAEKNEEKQEETKFEKSEDKQKHVKEKIDKMNPKKSKKKKIILLSIIGVILFLGIIFSTIFALFNINNEKIINGVTISGVDISKLSKAEAKEKIHNLFEDKKQKDLNLKYQDYENTLSPILLETEYNVDKAIDEAYIIGRKDNIFINNYEILFTLLGKKNIDVEMSLNEEMTMQKLDEISLNLPGAIVESSYSIEDDEMVITKGKPGIKVDSKEDLNLIIEDIES